MRKMRYFIDTHDSAKGTFPAGISKEDFTGFYEKYQAACAAEDVVSLRIHVGLGEGRAFCVTMAPDAEAVRRAHERVGLPFDSITEISTASPDALFALTSAA
ncbi:MAG: DUF4242 domain-containing protein [Parvularculaceae bacterium]